MRSKTWSVREWKELLYKNGYRPVRQTGSHVIYENDVGDTITVKFKDINKMIAKRMIKEHSLKV